MVISKLPLSRSGITLFLLLFAIFDISTLHANILVSPVYVVFNKAKRTKTVLVSNRSDKEQRYRVFLTHFKQLPSGEYIQTDTPASGEGFIDKLIRFGPRVLTLKPRETQVIRIQKRIPKNLEDGEYRSHMAFQPIIDVTPATEMDMENKGLSVELKTVYGVTIPIIYRHGDLKGTVDFSDVKNIKLKNQPALQLKLMRKGNKSIRGNLSVTLNSKTIAIMNNVAVYLSTDQRILSFGLYKDVHTRASFTEEELAGEELTIEFRALQEFGGSLLASALFNYPVSRR